MRFALFPLLLAACTSTPNPDPCSTCNPEKCPDPSQVVPNATCSVVPLVCKTPCGMKCQCWPDDAGNTFWISTTPCEGGVSDASDGGEAGDAGEGGDAADAGDAD
jgi:hypothetical protein